MKIAHSQDLVAYTLETSPGSERYIGQIQDIATGQPHLAKQVHFVCWRMIKCSSKPFIQNAEQLLHDNEN